MADYKLVYDAKQSNQPSVPADKVIPSSLEAFRTEWDADFGFFIADSYQGEKEASSKLNRQFVAVKDSRKHLTLLKVRHLERLIKLHYMHGITLTELRSLFESSCTVTEVDEWLDRLDKRLTAGGEVPLETLLRSLEEEKEDASAKPISQ